MKKHIYQWTRRDREHTKSFTLVALKNIGSRRAHSQFPTLEVPISRNLAGS
jgi:hypothetical protein